MLRPALLTLAVAAGLGAQTFIEKPYLQLGDNPKPAKAESMVLLWHAADADAGRWKVELSGGDAKKWRAAEAPAGQLVDAPGIPKHYVYRARLTGLEPGQPFRYRVLKDGAPVFEASGQARKSPSQPVRFVLFGDSSQDTPGQRAIAYQTSLAKPDFVFIAGDIVYSSGRISEYRDKYFPVYNADAAATDTGAPLIRSIPFIAAPGNHDTVLGNFQRFPDALAYFLYWDQPLNGPPGSHRLQGNEDAQPAFLAAAGARYPVMANFSFDYGPAHWTVLDSNTYVDWSDPKLRDWLRRDLAAAASAKWRFVAFHHPGFNSSHTHFTDQWMRALSPIFEEGKVDIVFAGHVHNYQRSFPLAFAPDGPKGSKGEQGGEWKLDRDFADGGKSRPRGVIYIVSGGGGASLYDTKQMGEPGSWQSFTDKFVSDVHSFSLVDLDGRTLTLRQISETGKEVDAFRIAK